jgi:hypothetical protein
LEDEVDCVALCFPPRGRVVSISARLAVVHTVAEGQFAFRCQCAGEQTVEAYMIIVASNPILGRIGQKGSIVLYFEIQMNCRLDV